MRLLHTVPFDKVISQEKEAQQVAYNISNAHVHLYKQSGDAVTTHALSGELYASRSGWILLSVPNALVRGAFDALNEHGVELPTNSTGNLNAHISVIRPEEIKSIGGIDKITERGHHFHYTLGPVQETDPSGWPEMSKVWFIQVRSPELQNLRKSYGLSPRPNNDKFDFHITIATRRKKILQNNDVAKAAGVLMPALRAGGIITDIAGLQALTGHDEEKDPAEEILDDESHLAAIQPPIIPTARRTRKVPVALAPILNGVNQNGLLDLQKEKTAGEAEGETEVPGEESGEGEEEDFSASPAVLAGISSYYEPGGTNDNSVPGDTSGTARTTGITGEFKSAGVIDSVKQRTAALYAKLEDRYGPTMAKTIIAAGLIGAPIPGPGTGLLTAAPFLAAGEALHAFRGKYSDPIEKRKQKQQESIEKLKTLGVPIGVASTAGLAGLALNKPTDTKVPAQVTQFPGDSKAHVIRGGIYPGAPPSVLEDTGKGYMVTGHDYVDRAHAHISDPQSFLKALKEQVKKDTPLQKLEIMGHGSFTGQNLGNASMVEGKPDPLKQLGPRTVKDVSEGLKDIPKTDDATLYMSGCNTGLCSPPAGSKPEHNWLKYLADNSGMTTMGARGYVTSEPNSRRWMDVHSTASGELPAERAGPFNIAGEDYAWTRHKPGKPGERVVTQNADIPSKRTFSSLPAGPLHELLYNIGKPSAIAGAIASPFLQNEQAAKNTALASSALAAPMALSEIITRYGDAQGQLATGNATDTLGTHLSAQSKALPYLGLAALPLLSYGGAKALGRWKGKEKPVDSSHETVGALGGAGAGMLAGSTLGPLGAAGGGALGALLGEFTGKSLKARKRTL